MEDPLKQMDDLGEKIPIFWKHPFLKMKIFYCQGISFRSRPEFNDTLLKW